LEGAGPEERIPRSFEDLTNTQILEVEGILISVAECWAQLTKRHGGKSPTTVVFRDFKREKSGMDRFHIRGAWDLIEEDCGLAEGIRWPSRDVTAKRSINICLRNPWTGESFSGFVPTEQSANSAAPDKWVLVHLQLEVLGNTRTAVLFSDGEVKWLTPAEFTHAYRPQYEYLLQKFESINDEFD
jgi:hypothetical protein